MKLKNKKNRNNFIYFFKKVKGFIFDNFLNSFWFLKFGFFIFWFVLLLIVILTVWLVDVNKKFEQSSTNSNSIFSDYYRAIDGQVTSLENINLIPVAVMIENHVDARPLSGINQASIVYEVIVEGDITRFLAIFAGDSSAKKIGPVRSARPFFIELAQEWNSIYLHSGGSQQALSLLRKSSVYNLDEISANGIYFWRDYQRLAPHNLYTSVDLINRAINAKGIATTTDILAWSFKKDQPAEQPTDLNIEVDFSNNELYNPSFIYNSQTNDYTRYLAGQIDKTSDGIFLKTKNIIIQK